MEAGNEALLQQILFQATKHVYQTMRERMLRGEPLGSTYDSDGRENYYVLEAINQLDTNPGPPEVGGLPAGLPLSPDASRPYHTFVTESPGDGYREICSPQPSPTMASNLIEPIVFSSETQPTMTSDETQPTMTPNETQPTMSSNETESIESTPTFATESTASSTASPTTPAHRLLEALGGTEVPYNVEAKGSAPAIHKASRLKRSFTRHQGRGPSGKRLMGDLDPENKEIMRLRQEKNLEFDEIAKVLNKKRMKTGQATTLTSNAIYSRYKRNAPLIAAAEGKEFVPTARDQKKNGQGIQFTKATVVKGFNEDEDALLVQAVQDIEDKKWELITARLQELGGKRHDPEMCALRYHHL